MKDDDVRSHVAPLGIEGKHTRFWWGNLKEGNNRENTGVDWRIILKWTVKKQDSRACIGLI